MPLAQQVPENSDSNDYDYYEGIYGNDSDTEADFIPEPASGGGSHRWDYEQDHPPSPFPVDRSPEPMDQDDGGPEAQVPMDEDNGEEEKVDAARDVTPTHHSHGMDNADPYMPVRTSEFPYKPLSRRCNRTGAVPLARFMAIHSLNQTERAQADVALREWGVNARVRK